MENYFSTEQNNSLWVLLTQTRDAIFKAWQKELGQHNILATQGAALSVIRAIGDKATPAEISRRLFREPHSVSALLNRMVKQGLVRKVKDLERKNQVRVEITEEGYRAYYRSMKQEPIFKIMSALSEEEQIKLRSYLQILLEEALKELGIEHLKRALDMSPVS